MRRMKRLSIRCLLALSVAFAAAPAFADDPCQQWDVPPTLIVKQWGGQHVAFLLKQEGTAFHGKAEYQTTKRIVIGNVSGSLVHDVFDARVLWTYSGVNAIGRYHGTVKPRTQVPAGQTVYGFVFEGDTYDEYDSDNYDYWNADHFICHVDAAPPPPAASAPARVAEPGFAQQKKHDAALAAIALEQAVASDSATMAVDRAQPAAASAPAPLPPIDAAKLDELAAKGGPIAQADPLSAILRARQAEGAGQRGFDIGMAAAENQTAPGPGKQRIRDSLARAERPGYDAAVTFSLERNSNKELAATGAAIVAADPAVAEARNANPDVFYQLGFDIASGLFGDPALGAHGNTLMGPGSAKIRDALNAAGQNGFNDSVTFHLARTYK